MVRWSWVNFQCRGVLLVWMIVGQGPFALAVGAGGGCLDIFTLNHPFFLLSPSLWETVRYRLKYCLKGPLHPKQPTNLPTHLFFFHSPCPVELDFFLILHLPYFKVNGYSSILSAFCTKVNQFCFFLWASIFRRRQPSVTGLRYLSAVRLIFIKLSREQCCHVI